VVTGLMGVGKTTTAEALADRLGWPLRDSDADITTLFGCSGAELAARTSVDELHRIEEAMLLGPLATPEPLVIAAAGWVIEDPHCRAAMQRRAHTVVLRIDVDEMIDRAATGDHRRPINRDEYLAQAARRNPLFDQVAAAWFDVDRPTDDLVNDIVAQLGMTPGATEDGDAGPDLPPTPPFHEGRVSYLG
jgi:shikimate kinase